MVFTVSVGLSATYLEVDAGHLIDPLLCLRC